MDGYCVDTSRSFSRKLETERLDVYPEVLSVMQLSQMALRTCRSIKVIRHHQVEMDEG